VEERGPVSSTTSVPQTRGRKGRTTKNNFITKTTRTTENEGNVMFRANNNDNNTIIMNKTK